MLLADSGFLTDAWRDAITVVSLVLGVLGLLIGVLGLIFAFLAKSAAEAAKEAAEATKKESEERFQAYTAQRAMERGTKCMDYIYQAQWALIASEARDLADELGGLDAVNRGNLVWQDDVVKLLEMASECGNLASGRGPKKATQLLWTGILNDILRRLHSLRRPV